MRSLFLRIFLWFWVSMTLIGLALVISEVVTRPEFEPPPGGLMESGMKFHAAGACAAFVEGGAAALDSYLRDVERQKLVRGAFFLDERGAEVRGRAVPPNARELAREALAGDATAHGRPHRLAAQRVRCGEPAGTYVLVVRVPGGGGPRGSWRDDLRRQGLRLVLIVLTSGAVCYGLARYIAAPVVKLRDATGRLAAGDFGARVGSSVGRRRDELARLGHDFDLMAERIESLVAAQRRLLGDISHELRSPLARLKVALHLARGYSGKEATAALDRIGREADRINSLIEQLLTLTRLESGAEEGEARPVDLPSLVEEIVADADFEARSRNRAVRVVARESCETTGTRELLRSAIENVVRNAVRHAPEGTIVEVSLRRRQEGLDDYAVVRVRDAGAGVPEEMLADIFRPFHRAEDARDRESGGAGLGLAITKRAVELHGGTVTATNIPGGGFAVEIRLPVSG